MFYSCYVIFQQVLTVGHDKGPAGVTVTLLTHDTKSVVKKTLSGQEGRLASGCGLLLLINWLP